MNIDLNLITVAQIVSGYKDKDEEGIVGYGGKLNIRPAYQREYVYKEEQRNEVIRTVMRGFPNTEFPLNVMYYAQIGEDQFELIDGQQRTISLCRYVNNDFSILIDGLPQNFDNLSQERKDHILNYKLQVYVCTGTADERLEWFSIINIAGEPLRPQELLNANFTGTWLSSAKLYFMKSNSPAYHMANKYIDIEANQSRGKGLETSINWISDDNIKQYMADHQNDKDADNLWQHFKLVIEWVQKTFPDYYSQMKGLNWGQLYDKYHEQNYDPVKVSKEAELLYNDEFVHKTKGIFEYILGGSIDTKLLEVRVFDKGTIKSVYSKQTKASKANKKSNCPHCALGHSANKNKIWELKEMDADHVKAWSKKGKTSIENCEMLCVTHNRAKGNK